MEQITPKFGSLKQDTLPTVSVGQKSEHGLAWIIGTRSLTGHSQGLGWGCRHHKAQLGQDPLPRSLMWLLAGLRLSLALGQRHQLLATWTSPQSGSQHDSWLPSEGASAETKKSLRLANIHWSYHVPHDPCAAGLIEQ